MRQLDFYISAHSPELAQRLADKIIDTGHRVLSQWHLNAGPKLDLIAADDWNRRVVDNVERIKYADVLLLLSAYPERVPGGKFFEAGCAFSLDLPIWVVGPIENGMVAGAYTRQFDTVDALLEALK